MGDMGGVMGRSGLAFEGMDMERRKYHG